MDLDVTEAQTDYAPPVVADLGTLDELTLGFGFTGGDGLGTGTTNS